MAFNWDDHPTVDASPSPTPEQPKESTAFNWDEHPTVGASATSTTPQADKDEDTLSAFVDFVAPSLEKAKTVASKIPLIGDTAKEYIETAQDVGTGLKEGLTGGFSDEIVGALKGAGKTGLEALTGELPQNKSTLEELYDNYRRYQKASEAENEAAHGRSPYGAGIGKFVGSFVPAGMAFKAISKAPMIAKMAIGAGLGGAQSLGESTATIEQPGELATEAGIGAGLGAIGVPVGEGIARGLAKGANYLANKIANSESGSQAAAAALNASKGGTVFGKAGPGAVVDLNEQMSEKMAHDIARHGPETNRLYTEAFAGTDKTLRPSSSNAMKNLDDFFEDAAKNRDFGRFTEAEKQAVKNYQAGNLTPQEANNFVQKLKELRTENFQNGPYKNAITNLINDLEAGIDSTLDNTTLARLNGKRRAAYELMEPFIQKANEVVPNPAFQNLKASDLSMNQAKQRIKDLTGSLIEKSGYSTDVGTGARHELAKLQEALKDINSSVNFNINPAEMATDMMNQGYLNAARLARQGIRQTSNLRVDKANILSHMKDYGSLWLAEKGGQYPGVQNFATKLLKQSPMELRESGRALYNNPKTRNLGEQLITAADLNDKQKLTNIAFQAAQMPEAKDFFNEQLNSIFGISGNNGDKGNVK